MAQRARALIARNLKKKGFAKSGGDHAFYTLHVDGKQTAIFTKLSGGTSYKEYGDSLLGKMARQLKVSKDDLLSLIDCDLDQRGYRQKLSDKGLVAAEEKGSQ